MEFKLSKRDAEEFAFEYEKEGKVLAEIIWTQLGDIMVVEHTFVDSSLRGQGIAKQLLNRAADYARENEYKIEAVCSYVVKAFETSHEYDDIKA
ncbi:MULTISPECIES: GNAT family N-acetyltransferase [unclassified Rummeliibacillus]|uniref:GNAT family N-acetyltransferase n=1 Tax=unclassified Rummeliibacillus TaxID=2622809 RepID=UPI000E667B49|nr:MULTISPECIES: GNAT family N-acetyltransferase [unclassified Rummeliibacillus]RIJ64384.1 N-acetyltransferase [Rummeliibacillus sp. POC4]RPJ96548.1 N-acetyltransferase [Rummeliibacillus sp. TYF005]